MGISGVILSLIFVGLELQQSSAIARMEARQNYITPLSENFREYSTDPQFTSLFVSTFDPDKDISDYSEPEIAQVRGYYGSQLFV
jgi:hypothetical protein